MFAYAYAFKDIGGWDVSSVTNMEDMFRGVSTFNQYIGGWDVSSVTTMKYMFYNAYVFLDIGGWDVSSVTSIYICEHSISQLTYTSSDDAICKSISINLHTIIIRCTTGKSKMKNAAKNLLGYNPSLN
jgi:surface protein